MRLRSGLSACLLAAALATPACTAPAKHPDIVLITLDTTRPDHLGCYGYPHDTSPNLDRFAERSTLYERAYATSSWTLPSHASLFTGLLPMEHGAQSMPEGPNRSLDFGVRPLAESFTTLAELLKEAGYRTGAVIAGPALRSELGVGQGFEVYDDEFSGLGEKFHGRRAELVADRAIALWASFGESPSFLFVNFFDPHAPYHPPSSFEGALPPQIDENEGARQGELLKALLERLSTGQDAIPLERMDPGLLETLNRQIAGYDAEIAYMDHHLGRLLRAVVKPDSDRPILVFITADHGESFGEHYFLKHGAHLYEDNVRVPLLVYDSREAVRETVPAPVQNHRVFASILDAAGIELPEGIDTAELSARSRPVVLEVHRSDANIRLFGSFFDRDLRAIYEPPYKLIESSTGKTELYDLSVDPVELTDRAATMPETAASLSSQLELFTGAHPARFVADDRAQLRPETAEALKALGYMD